MDRLAATCLIPVTRLTRLPFVASQLKADGWDVVHEVDEARQGPSMVRNRLLASVIDHTDYIRFADDDDVVLPHRELAIAALADADVAYFDFMIVTRQGVTVHHFTGDVLEDLAVSPGPWAWVARSSALRQFVAEGLFTSPYAAIEGGYAFLKMYKAGLRFVHVPAVAYRWFPGTSLENVNNHPDRDRYLAELQAEVRALPRSS